MNARLSTKRLPYKRLPRAELTMRELCEQHGMYRPIDFARAAGISKAYAHLLWTGKRLVGRKMALKLAPVFQVSPESLIMIEAPSPKAP